MFDLAAVQAAVRDLGLDGWLLYDFRGLNVLARRVIGLAPDQILSRRWFYFVPAQGEPRKLVHRIESGALDVYPVCQFEKLWGDMTVLPEVDCGFVVVPRLRGQQLKDPAQLDGWLRDGSAAHVEGLAEWE